MDNNGIQLVTKERKRKLKKLNQQYQLAYEKGSESVHNNLLKITK